jgi:hypothetical protein
MKTHFLHSLRSKGFALVVTISLLVLLAVIALGFLSLSAITLRSGSQEQAQMEARANARLALTIAIGELQKQLGPDQRISANGAITGSSGVLHPHLTGVWDSWVAGPMSDAPVNDAYPSAESHHRTIGDQPDDSMRPAYDEKNRHFRAWLTSLHPDEATDPGTPASLSLGGVPMPDKNAEAIRLVGPGSLGELAPPLDINYVSARLLGIKPTSTDSGFRGRYAWWVGDESQKARVMNDTYYGEELTSAEKIFRSQAPGSTGTTTMAGLNTMTPAQEERLEDLPSLNTLDLVPGVEEVNDGGTFRASQKNFHTVTPFSNAILADVREGGLKRDLSTLLEREIKLDESSDEFMLYRFDTYRDDRVPLQDLAAYFQLYHNDPNRTSGKRGGIVHNAAASRVMQVNTPDYGDQNNKNKFLREYTSLYRNPVPVRVQFVLGVGATAITDAERTAIAARGIILRASDRYKLLLGVKPVVSLWNPNNTPLVMGTDASQIIKVGFPPFTLRWKKYRADGLPAEYQSVHLNLNYAISNESTGDGRARSLAPLHLADAIRKKYPDCIPAGGGEDVFHPHCRKQFFGNRRELHIR